MSSYKLLMTDSPQEAHELAIWLEQKNAERQRLTTKALAKAREQVLAQGISPLLIASDRDYPGRHLRAGSQQTIRGILPPGHCYQNWRAV